MLFGLRFGCGLFWASLLMMVVLSAESDDGVVAKANGGTRVLRRRAPLEESRARLWFPCWPGLSGRGDVQENL
ncbi:hypothetical protein Dimus_030421 [Dionaea muscipula]